MAERKLPKCIVEVLPGIFLGNKDASVNFELLKSLKIKFVLNVGGGKNMFENKGLEYYKVTIADSKDTSILPYLDMSCDFVHTNAARGHVLVHCRGGFSRSPTVTIAYLMKYHKMTYAEGLEFVKKKRNCVQPNGTFVDNLLTFERMLKDR